MKSPAYMAACVAAVLMWSCGTPPEVHEGGCFHSVPVSGWAYGDTFEFEPSPEPDSCDATARLAIAVRHDDAYLYGNLWLEVSTPAEQGDSMVVDTVNIRLADVYGKWLGRGTAMSYMAVDTLPGVYMYRPDVPARIRHIMRTDTLLGIEQVGLIYLDITPVPPPVAVPDTVVTDTTTSIDF